MRECGAWDGRLPKRGGLDFPWFWDRAGGPWWNVARAFLPGGFFKSSSSQVSAAGHFRRESEIRGSRSVIHGRARLLPKALREIGNWVAHKARGPTSVALQSRENELSFLVLDDARFQALVRSFGPTGGLVHSGGGRHAEMALGALVERDAAGVLTEGRRRGPVRLKILGLRSRSCARRRGYLDFGGGLGTGTRARLHGAAAQRDPAYLD